MRIGIGHDIHPLVPGRKFILGGIVLPYEKGPQGHSDGDALFHALADALLGAAGLGDIGRHFPDEDSMWKDADSSLFLTEVAQKLKKFTIENIDANLFLEQPKLAPHLPRMIAKIASLLKIPKERINLKAKRGEGLDAVGEGRAVAAQVVCLLQSTTR